MCELLLLLLSAAAVRTVPCVVAPSVRVASAMKLYIGLSRVKTANVIILTGMINLALFTN